jgi:hypothetical protein
MRMLRPRLLLGILGVALLSAHLVAVDGPLTNALNLRVRTDGNGYLVSAGGAYSGVDGPLTNFGNLRLRTDGNGYLIVTLAAASSITVNNLVTTSTDGLVLQNTTAATVGVTAQYSPRLRLRGAAWKSNATAASQTSDWILENIPASGAAAITSDVLLYHQTNAVTDTGSFRFSSIGGVTVSGTGSFVLPAGGLFYWNTRTILNSTADGLLSITNNAQTLNVFKNMTAAAESVTFRAAGAAETIAGNSSNFRITVGGTPGTTATVTFGTAWTTAPVCHAQNEVTANILKAAAAVGQVVLTGIVVAGDTITVHCEGY